MGLARLHGTVVELIQRLVSLGTTVQFAPVAAASSADLAVSYHGHLAGQLLLICLDFMGLAVAHEGMHMRGVWATGCKTHLEGIVLLCREMSVL